MTGIGLTGWSCWQTGWWAVPSRSGGSSHRVHAGGRSWVALFWGFWGAVIRCSLGALVAGLPAYFNRLRSSTSRALSKYGCQVISGRPSRRQSRTFCSVLRAMWGQRLHAQVLPSDAMIPGTGM